MNGRQPTRAGFYTLVHPIGRDMRVRAFQVHGVWMFESCDSGQIYILREAEGCRWIPEHPISPPQLSTSEQVGQACADAGTETPDDGGRGTNLIGILILVAAVGALSFTTLDPIIPMSFAAGGLLLLAAFVLSARRSRQMREAQTSGVGSGGSHDAVTTGASCEATTKSGGE